MLGDEDGLEGLGMLGDEDGLEGLGMLGDEDGLEGLGMLGDEDGLEGLGMLGVDGVVWGLWQPDRSTTKPMDARVNLFIKRARTVIISVIFQIKAELNLNFESLRLNKFNSKSYGSTCTKV